MHENKRDILGLDLEQVNPQEVDEIFRGAMFNKDISSPEVLAVAEVAVKLPRKLTKLKPKREKGDLPDESFRLVSIMRRG